MDCVNFWGACSTSQINQGIVESIPIPLTPLTAQKAIIGETETELALVADNCELSSRFEQKIQATLSRIWGEDNQAAAEADA